MKARPELSLRMLADECELVLREQPKVDPIALSAVWGGKGSLNASAVWGGKASGFYQWTMDRMIRQRCQTFSISCIETRPTCVVQLEFKSNQNQVKGNVANSANDPRETQEIRRGTCHPKSPFAIALSARGT
jgi:hypothetical protein